MSRKIGGPCGIGKIGGIGRTCKIGGPCGIGKIGRTCGIGGTDGKGGGL